MSEPQAPNKIQSLIAKFRKGADDYKVTPSVELPSAPPKVDTGALNPLAKPVVSTAPKVESRVGLAAVNDTSPLKTEKLHAAASRVAPNDAKQSKMPPVDIDTLTGIGVVTQPEDAVNSERLGEALIKASLITREHLNTALARQAASGQLLGRVFLDLGFVTREQLKREIKKLHGDKISTGSILARLRMPAHHIRATVKRKEQFREPLTDIMRDWRFLSQESVAKVIAIENNLEFFPWTEIDDISIEKLRQYNIDVSTFRGYVPITYEKRQDERDHIAIVISDMSAIADATSAYRDCVTHFLVASSETTQTIYRRFFAKTEEAFEEYLKQHREAVNKKADLSSTTLYLDMFMALLRHACYTGASDISMHKSHKVGMIRLKQDGVWDLFRSLPYDLLDQLFGVMRNNMIEGVTDEKLRDGFSDCALDLNTKDKDEHAQLRRTYADIIERYVFRVEIGNSVQGQTVTIRVNDTQSTAAELNQLGFDPQTMARLRAYSKVKNGVFLICGPTGSGKTTSLYALMGSVDPLTVSIQTVERPVEYTHGLWQQFDLNRVNKDEGEQWAEALKGLLRNAPDIILYGETRDGATAQELFRAANTGHLVLSTLHTNGAAEAIERLEDLGIPKSKMATVLQGVLAQRLVRKLCTHCKVRDERTETKEMLSSYSTTELKHITRPEPYRAREMGCVNCGHTGYRGRRMVYELLHCSKEIRGRLEKNASLTEIKSKGIINGTMLENGLKLVAEGVTSIDELAAHIDLEV